MSRTIPAAVLLAACTLTPVATQAQRVEGRNESTWATLQMMDRGESLKLVSPNGAISITEGRGNELVVRAEKRVEGRARIDDVGFVVRRVNDVLVICAVYEDEDECLADGERGRNRRSSGWNGRNRASANFTVQLPAGVSVKAMSGNGAITISGGGNDVQAATGNGRILVSNTTGRVKASTGNGRITVEGARGPVDASTGNGPVAVTTSSGPVNVSSGNGDIDVTMNDVEQASAMKFGTGSGNITLAVPSRFGAELEASTGSGDITTSIPIQLVGRATRNRLRATLGDGGERLALSTGSGDITIKKSR
jgi:hypothetical protein